MSLPSGVFFTPPPGAKTCQISIRGGGGGGMSGAGRGGMVSVSFPAMSGAGRGGMVSVSFPAEPMLGSHWTSRGGLVQDQSVEDELVAAVAAQVKMDMIKMDMEIAKRMMCATPTLRAGETLAMDGGSGGYFTLA